MAFKALVDGINADFYNAADSFGYFDDVVYGLRESITYRYDIFTYRGRDLIDLRDVNPLQVYLVFAGSDDDRVLGGNSVERVSDQSGNDLYTLGGNDDFVTMGLGDDTIDGDRGSDTISFERIVGDFGAESFSNVGVRVDLRVTTVQNLGIFGRDVIRNVEKVIAYLGNDTLIGNSTDNFLFGNGGNDALRGFDGADTLDGSTGSDTIDGGRGVDILFCGDSVSMFNAPDGQRDIVRFRTISDSTSSTVSEETDMIIFFDAGGTATDDRIDLSAIDARAGTRLNDAFVFRGVGGEFSSAKGEIRIVETNGSSMIFIDNDRDAAAEMTIFVQSVTGLTAGDFIL